MRNMKTKAQVLNCLDRHHRGLSPSLRKRKEVVASAAAVRKTAKRNPSAVCWRCGFRRSTQIWHADHLCPMQVCVDFGRPHYLAAACADCNRERQKEFPYSDQVARLKTDSAVLSHPAAEIFDFLGELSQELFGSPRHSSLLIGWIPGFPLFTLGANGWRVEYEAGNKRLMQAGLL